MRFGTVKYVIFSKGQYWGFINPLHIEIIFIPDSLHFNNSTKLYNIGVNYDLHIKCIIFLILLHSPMKLSLEHENISSPDFSYEPCGSLNLSPACELCCS